MPKTTVETTLPVPTSTSASDTMAPALRELLAIFDGPLAEVRFPGVDRGMLLDLAAQVEGESVRVEELRAQLDTAYAGLIEVKGRLQRAAEQGLAYARVFSAGDPELTARLAEVNLAGEPRRRKAAAATGEPDAAAAEAGESADGTIRLPPRRGRKPKVAAEEATGS